MSESPLPQTKPPCESDLNALLAAQVRENRFIEFKGEYLPQTDGGKKKFLQAVSSFANARGGDLILGMEEVNGVATALAPLSVSNVDQCRLQILDLIRVHLRPRLGGVQVHLVPFDAGGHVIVVRVPKSWAGPHMLTYGDERRFYIRDDGAKRPMEYEDVRDSFLAGEATGSRLRNFRMERCAAILSDETPRPLAHTSRLVIHLLPFDMFALPRRFEVRELHVRCQNFQPITNSSYDQAFDVDGCFAYNMAHDGAMNGYAYVFRNGAIEAVDSASFASRQNPDEKGISSGFESPLIRAVEGHLTMLASLEVPPPYAFFLSLLNVRGCSMNTASPWREAGHPIARDHLYIAEAVFDSAPLSVASTLFDVFNGVWNACGYEQSQNYDRNGSRKPNSP